MTSEKPLFIIIFSIIIIIIIITIIIFIIIIVMVYQLKASQNATTKPLLTNITNWFSKLLLL